MLADSFERTEVRSDCENPVGKNLANGHPVAAAEQETLFLQRHSITGHVCASDSKWKWSTIGLSVLLVISVAINIYMLAEKLRQVTVSLDAGPCPQHWVRNGGRCYFFSDTEQTWNASWIDCSSQGGSLLAMDAPEEWAFVSQSKKPRYYWIGLWRTEVGELWKWANGSLFNNWFPVGGEGLCAYLSKDMASSTWCDKHRYWICSKHLHGNT